MTRHPEKPPDLAAYAAVVTLPIQWGDQDALDRKSVV